MLYRVNKSDAALPGNLLIGSVVTEMPPFCFGLGGAQVATTEVHLPQRQCTPPSDSHRKRVSYSSPTESDLYQIEVTSVPIPPPSPRVSRRMTCIVFSAVTTEMSREVSGNNQIDQSTHKMLTWWYAEMSKKFILGLARRFVDACTETTLAA